jgi:hypothetical protein
MLVDLDDKPSSSQPRRGCRRHPQQSEPVATPRVTYDIRILLRSIRLPTETGSTAGISGSTGVIFLSRDSRRNEKQRSIRIDVVNARRFAGAVWGMGAIDRRSTRASRRPIPVLLSTMMEHPVSMRSSVLQVSRRPTRTLPQRIRRSSGHPHAHASWPSQRRGRSTRAGTPS